MNQEVLKQAEHARRRANRAARKGDLAAAERWSKTAERLAAAVKTVEVAQAEQVDYHRRTQAEAEEVVCQLFIKVAHIANAMVHTPTSAPGAFIGLIKLWREMHLGEGAEDAEAGAARIAAMEQAHLEGRFEDTLPEYVRQVLDETWQRRRAELEGQPPIPHYWTDNA
jgi:hypothetical protein